MPDAPAPNTDLAYADTLWKSADTLRGQIDARPSRHWKVGAAEPSGDSSQSLRIPSL